MTTETKYIIENKRFMPTWDDYVVYLQFIVPVLTSIVGLIYLYEGTEIKNYLVGTLLVVISFPLAKFLLIRLRQLNRFEELKNELTREENFEYCIIKLKTLNIVAVDHDIHNFTISAKYKSTFIPPMYEWLTIVCLDNKILVNSRPTPAIILFWLRRNAVVEFVKSV